MKSRSLSKAKGNLAKIGDQALEGHSTFDALIQEGKDSAHRPFTDKVLKKIWQRGRSNFDL